MVTVHDSPGWKFVFGVMMWIRPPFADAVVASLWEPVEAQVMSYQAPSTSTASVKFSVMLASRGALSAPNKGSVLKMAGPISTMGAVCRGSGGPVTKSAPFSSVSCWPPTFRKRAVVLLGAGALAAPSWQSALVP